MLGDIYSWFLQKVLFCSNFWIGFGGLICRWGGGCGGFVVIGGGKWVVDFIKQIIYLFLYS
jgi:hypothetical protein